MFGTWAMIRSNDGPEGTESTAFLVGFEPVSASFTSAIQITPAQAAKIASKMGRLSSLSMRNF